MVSTPLPHTKGYLPKGTNAAPRRPRKQMSGINASSCAWGRRGPSFAYSLPVHSFHTRRDRVASLTTCRLHGAATQRASPLGSGRTLTLPCGWNNAGPRAPYILCRPQDAKHSGRAARCECGDLSYRSRIEQRGRDSHRRAGFRHPQTWPVQSKIRVPLFAARTLFKCHRLIPGHSIAALTYILTEQSGATAEGKGG